MWTYMILTASKLTFEAGFFTLVSALTGAGFWGGKTPDIYYTFHPLATSRL